MELTIISGQQCVWCTAAADKLKFAGFDVNMVKVESNAIARELLLSKGLRTVPQIFYGDIYIGDFNTIKDMSKDMLVDFITSFK